MNTEDDKEKELNEGSGTSENSVENNSTGEKIQDESLDSEELNKPLLSDLESLEDLVEEQIKHKEALKEQDTSTLDEETKKSKKSKKDKKKKKDKKGKEAKSKKEKKKKKEKKLEAKKKDKKEKKKDKKKKKKK